MVEPLGGIRHYAYMTNGSNGRLIRVYNGIEVEIAHHGPPYANIASVIEIHGDDPNDSTHIWCVVDGVTVIDTHDSNLTNGYPGLRCDGLPAGSFEDWEGSGAFTVHGDPNMSRTYYIVREYRTVSIDGENRFMEMMRENRNVSIPFEDRVVVIPEEKRNAVI